MIRWVVENWGIVIRWFIYVSIASTTTIIAETGTSDLGPVWGVTLKASLSGLIAWRAFMDETMAWAKINKQKEL